MEGSDYGMNHIQKAINLAPKNAKFLDIGCGSTGRIIDEALKKDFRVTGIDISSEMINLAQKNHHDVEFIHNDFVEWKSPEHYDLIIAWDSIFHAPKNHQSKATRKMCNLLNKNGILLFTAGGIEDERSGYMEGVKFEYGSLSYLHYLNIIEEMGCKIILMESDQYPLDHMVFICQKTKSC